MLDIHREAYFRKIEPYIGQPELIKVITGMRRSGKSYFLRQVIDSIKLKNKNAEIVFIDKESLEYAQINDHLSLNAYVKKKHKSKSTLYLFIDEVQEIKDWELAIRSLYNTKNVDIYLTGSNSDTLSSELSSYLTGRYVEISVYPLVFSEFLLFRADKAACKEEEFYNFLRYGGLPAIHLLPLEDEAIYGMIKSIYDTVLLKDLVKKYDIRNVALLENICNYAFSHIGSNLSAANISKFLKSEKISVGNDTIQNYLAYACSAYLLAKAKNYDIKGKKIFAINDKYFVSDVGMKNAVQGYRAGDISGILENVVFTELRYRGYEVYVGKIDELEVDFIAQKRDQRIYIQVAYLLEKPETLARELRPLLRIADNYPKYLLSLDKTPRTNHEGIECQSVIEFLLSN